MPSNASEELPQNRQALARIVAGDAETPERRQRAFECLAAWILHVAEQVDGRFGGHLGQDFIGEALTLVWERLAPGPLARFDPAKGEFEPWCRTVIVRRAIDVWRQQRRERARQASETALENQPDMTAVQEQSSREAEVVLQLLVEQRRVVLDEMRWQPVYANGVDYFGVLLLHLRLAIAERVGTEVAESDLELPDTMSYLLTRYLPWRAAEENLRFKPAWPTLGEIWLSLKECLDQPPYRLSIVMLCETLTRLLRGAGTVTPDLWYQWLKRSKTIAKGRIDAATWNAFFAVWLPDRKLSPGEKPLGVESAEP
jgi:DNA-directed RNA polymerase specialized sigma24 family protein